MDKLLMGKNCEKQCQLSQLLFISKDIHIIIQSKEIMKSQNYPRTDTNLNKENIDEGSEVSSRVSETGEQFIRMRINADNLVKSKLILFIVLGLFYLLFICLIAFLALPKTFRTIDSKEELEKTSLAACNTYLKLQNQTKVVCNTTQINSTSQNTSELYNLSFGNFVQYIRPLNQFIIFYFQLTPAFQESFLKMNISVLMRFRLYKTTKTSQDHIHVNKVKEQWLYSINNRLQKYSDGQIYLGYVSAKSQDDYYYEVSFNNSEIFNNQTNSFTLKAVTVRSEFSLFAILLRVALFAISLIVCVKFCMNLRKLPEDKITIEQKMVRVLSVLTLFFNDLLYFLTVLFPNGFTAFLNTLFFWNYIFCLYVIWVIFLNRIIDNQLQNITNQFSLGQKILLILFYLAIFIVLLIYAISKNTYHPIRQSGDIQRGYLGLAFLAVLAIICMIFYMVFLYARICQMSSQLLWRHKVFIGISIIFFILTIIFFFNGSYDIYQISAPKIMFALCTLTFFSIFLQYAYNPSEQQVEEYQRQQPKRTKDLAKQYLLKQNNINDDAILQIQDYSLYHQDVQTLNQKYQSSNKKQQSIRQRKRKRNKISQKQKSSDKSSSFEDSSDPHQIVINSNQSGEVINNQKY